MSSCSGEDSSESQTVFVKIIKQYPVLLEKSNIPEVKKKRHKAVEEIKEKLEAELGVKYNEGQIWKKIQNIKTRLKAKTDKNQTGNKPIKLKGWEQELFNFLQGESNSTIARLQGKHPAKGLWGMKHTRKPIDYLVAQAKSLPADVILPIVKLQVTKDGANYVEITDKRVKSDPLVFPVDAISYGVQDIIYTRIFSMILVTDDNLNNGIPFECHSFVCDSRDQARKITYALAAAFQDYGKRVKSEGMERKVKKFAIDLRTPEEQAANSDGETGGVIKDTGSDIWTVLINCEQDTYDK